MQNSKCLNCGKDSTSSKGRKRKYCGKKCASQYAHKRDYKPKHADWGTRTPKRLKERQERKAKFEWYSNNWLTATEIGERLDISSTAVHHRAKTLGIAPTIVAYASRTAFWSPEQVEQLSAEPTPIPEGLVTSPEAAELIGCPLNAFHAYVSQGRIFAAMDWQDTHGNRVHRKLYRVEDVEKLKVEREAWFDQRAEWERTREDRQLVWREAQRLKRKAESIRRAQEKSEAIGDYLSTQEVATVVGYKTGGTVLGHMRNGRISGKQMYNSFYFSPEEVQQYKESLEVEREAIAQRRLLRRRNGVPKRQDDWTSNKAYEAKLFSLFDKILHKYTNTNKYTTAANAIEANKKYKRLKKSGVITKFDCKTCHKKQCYEEFYFDASYAIGRKLKECKTCQRRKGAERYHKNKEQIKAKRIKNFPSKFRILIAQAIKHDLSRHVGTYVKMSTADVWESLEKNCGYNLEQFLNHIEAQFDQNMHWLNHGRGTEQYYWQIDHIVPRSTFVFKSLDDAAFIKCWGLDNLRPLSAYENCIRQFKKDRHSESTRCPK